MQCVGENADEPAYQQDGIESFAGRTCHNETRFSFVLNSKEKKKWNCFSVAQLGPLERLTVVSAVDWYDAVYGRRIEERAARIGAVGNRRARVVVPVHVVDRRRKDAHNCEADEKRQDAHDEVHAQETGGSNPNGKREASQDESWAIFGYFYSRNGNLQGRIFETRSIGRESRRGEDHRPPQTDADRFVVIMRAGG